MDWTGYNFYFRRDGYGDLPDTEGIIFVSPEGLRMGVPSDTKNRDWQMYQAWLVDGYSTLSE